MEKITWYTTEHQFSVFPNHYYFLRLRAEDKKNIGETITIQCRFTYSGRILEISLPIVSGLDKDFAQCGAWLERYLVFQSGIMEYGVSLLCSHPDCRIIADLNLWPVELSAERDESLQHRIQETISQARHAEITLFKKRWTIFEGLDALNNISPELFISPWKESAAQSLPAPAVQEENFKPHVLCWGDNLFIQTLSQKCSTVSMAQRKTPHADNEHFNAILIQGRSSRRYLPDAVRELNYITSLPYPIYTMEDSDGGTICIRKSDEFNHIEFSGNEADLLTIIPTNRTQALNKIAIPCASDLYQFSSFQNIANRFLNVNYKISVFESLYQHKTRATWERFAFSPQVEVHGRLSLQEQVKEFRNSAFVLICGYSLRNIADIQTIACAALMSGSLPVVIGDALPAYEFIDHFFSFENCFSYIKGIDILTFQRIWLGKFRKLMCKINNSQIRHNFLAEISGTHLKTNSCPSAEIICVSKRPENLAHIVKNIQRQSYKNLAAHIILNVDQRQADYCKYACQSLDIPDLRLSIIDTQYNIGSCLNSGIQSSSATYWFKFDDDDYYGKFYIEDIINYYTLGNFDAVFKPAFFTSFRDKTLWGRKATADRYFTNGLDNYGCGATLSGRRCILPFSSVRRNSCDSAWQDALRRNQSSIFIGDNFNYCTFRHAPENHTWQIDDATLKKRSYKLGFFSKEYLDAE